MATETIIADPRVGQPPSTPRSRVRGLDLARAIALLGMVLAHFGPAAIGGGSGGQAVSVAPTESSAWESIVRFTDGRAMPLFVMLSGCGLTFLFQRSRRPWREMLGRAMLLLLLGLALQFTAPIDVILYSYAFFFLAATPMRKLPTRWLLPAGAAVTVIGAISQLFLNSHLPAIAEIAPTDFSSSGGLYLLGHPWTLLSDVLFTGFYPLFPSLAFILVGMWIARQNLNSRRVRSGLVGVGMLMAVVGYGVGWASDSHRAAVPAAVDGATTPELDDALATADAIGTTLSDVVDDQAKAAGITHDEAVAAFAERMHTTPEIVNKVLQDGSAAESTVPTWDLLDASGHSNMPAWMIGAGGFAAAVVGMCLVIADRFSRFTIPLVALGQMALTAYVAQIALYRWPLKNWPWNLSLATAVLATFGGWLAAATIASAWKAKYHHGPFEYVLRLAGRTGSIIGRKSAEQG